jgi:hypothetical protein|tara:strand:+ start:714 stop:1184 length:471 start_codon:yes stop_codon:yes gene_type:complete
MNINIQSKKNLVNKINSLSTLQQNEIFNIFKKNNLKYSHNSNGIFINITNLDCNIFDDINKYITYLKSNKDTNIKYIIKCNKNVLYEENKIINFKEFMNLNDIYFLKNIELNLIKNIKKENHLKFMNTLKKYNRFLCYTSENENTLNNLNYDNYFL